MNKNSSGVKPGPTNSLADVAGIKTGHAHDPVLRSGVTVVIPDQPIVAACDIRGGGPGTRETVLLDPVNTVDKIHGLFFSGGSAFGLEAASGLVEWLRIEKRGFEIAGAHVPIVPGAILFDLANGGQKDWTDNPYPALAHKAIKHATEQGPDIPVENGNFGAGYGAKAGWIGDICLKGGLGQASLTYDMHDGPVTIGGLAAVNSFGSPLMPNSDVFWAWPFEINNEFGGRRPALSANLTNGSDRTQRLYQPPIQGLSTNTTLAVLATNLALTKAEAKRMAIMAQDGLARSLRPVHSPLDGDSVFVLSTGSLVLDESTRFSALWQLGMLGADVLARAIARGVYEAETLGDMRSYKDLFGSS